MVGVELDAAVRLIVRHPVPALRAVGPVAWPCFLSLVISLWMNNALRSVLCGWHFLAGRPMAYPLIVLFRLVSNEDGRYVPLGSQPTFFAHSSR